MKSSEDRARERLARYELEHRDAVHLARLASLAVRIEPQLLRRLRTELLPDADVGTEADLWFSPLIESRGPAYVILNPRIAHVLRESFRTRTGPGSGGTGGRSDLLRRAIAITSEVHRGMAPTLLLEERVNALAVGDAPDGVAAIDRALQPAVRALHEASDAADAIAQWALGAFGRFHPTVWKAPSALALRLATHLRLGLRRSPEHPADANIRLEDVAWVLPPNLLAERVTVGVELVPHGLRFCDAQPNGPAIELPRTDPLAVSVVWNREGQRNERFVAATPGSGVEFDAELDEVNIRTLSGEEYLVAKTAGAPRRKQCFVIMAFGRKTDYATGRMLDLDQTYRQIIKPAVEQAGLECVRADEFGEAGFIAPRMFELLLDADFVVADISTANAYAIYQLGVRHALRPQTTIVIAEKESRAPFDSSSVEVRTYEHRGEGIEPEEAERMREELSRVLLAHLQSPQVDSPVYTSLPSLEPPVMMPGESSVEASPVESSAREHGETLRRRNRTCLVLMGFGKQTDYPTGRTLDLDTTYAGVIRGAVEPAGFECIRLDEIVPAGTLNRPICELLLNADLVVADLSAANPNAIYQLGVRHALRPRSTIVIAEREFRPPFAIEGLRILIYTHLGEDLGHREAKRAQHELANAIEHSRQSTVTDSPVYRALPHLRPPPLDDHYSFPARRSEKEAPSAPKAPRIFLSYAREDSEFARALFAELRRLSLFVWFDQEDLAPAAQWEFEIHKAVTESAYFLPVISQQALREVGMSESSSSAAARSLRFEWETAQRAYDSSLRTREYILPVAIDDTRESDPDLARFEGFLNRNWVRIKPGDREALHVFALEVRDLVRKREADGSADTPGHPGRISHAA